MGSLKPCHFFRLSVAITDKENVRLACPKVLNGRVEHVEVFNFRVGHEALDTFKYSISKTVHNTVKHYHVHARCTFFVWSSFTLVQETG